MTRFVHSGIRAIGYLAVAMIFGLLLSACASISPGPAEYPYHEHTPSADEMERGRRAYRAGMHRTAFMHYRNAARWADKFAQYNVGVMYLRGEGVEFDPIRGWAWIQLAAERNYPQFEETADDLFELLGEKQQRLARNILEQELLPKYGDEVKIERADREMRSLLRKATGTRTGSQGFLAMLTVYDGSGIPRRGTEYYDSKKWDFRRVVEFETRLMIQSAGGRADVGEFEVLEDENSDDPSTIPQPGGDRNI